MKDRRHDIIQTICDLDYKAVVDLLDDDALHFETTKDRFLPFLKDFFEWVPTMIDCSKIEAQAINCCRCEKVDHNNIVLFSAIGGYFIFDIQHTIEGKFSLDFCDSCEPNAYKGQDIGPYTILIPYDLLVDFVPDTIYLKLLSEKEKMLEEIDNDSVIFWFKDDVEAFLKKYAWAKENMRDKGSGMFAFDNFISFLKILVNLNKGMQSENICQMANRSYSLVNQYDAWEIYEWYYCQERRGCPQITASSLNLNNIEKGYFSINNHYPNLRFSVFGHQEFLKFTQNWEEALEKTEDLRADCFVDQFQEGWSL